MTTSRIGAIGGLTLAIVLLAGCTQPAPAPATVPEVESAGPSSTPTTSPSPSAAASVETSSRGNIVKAPGDTFGFWDDPAAPQAKFVVTAITMDPQCTTDYATPSENGHFVRLDLEGETGADLEGEMFMGTGAWTVVAENGTTFNGNPSTGAAYGCLNDAERFPDTVGPGERVAGSIILDVPTASGVLILNSYSDGGWEWAYPQ